MADVPTQRIDVRLLTFNAYLLPSGMHPRTFKDQRMALLPSRLSGFDVVALSEVFFISRSFSCDDGQYCVYVIPIDACFVGYTS